MDNHHRFMENIHFAMVPIHIDNLTLYRHLDLKELNDQTHSRKLKLKTTIWKNTTKNSHCLFW